MTPQARVLLVGLLVALFNAQAEAQSVGAGREQT